jgi:hypothetical protein
VREMWPGTATKGSTAIQIVSLPVHNFGGFFVSKRQKLETSVHDFEFWRDELLDRKQTRLRHLGELILTDKELREIGYSPEQIKDIQAML